MQRFVNSLNIVTVFKLRMMRRTMRVARTGQMACMNREQTTWEVDVGEGVREKVGVTRVRTVLVWRRVWAVGRVL